MVYQMVTDPHLQFCKEKIDQTQLQWGNIGQFLRAPAGPGRAGF